MPTSYVSHLNPETRQRVGLLLNARLSDAIAMTLAAKQAHWTIKGPSFIGIHELLDDVADRLRDGADSIAERCVVLGVQPSGTVELVASASKVSPYPGDIQNQTLHIEALTERLMAFGAALRDAIAAAADAGDDDTADLFTEISRTVDKDAWFVGAHSAAGTAGASRNEAASQHAQSSGETA